MNYVGAPFLGLIPNGIPRWWTASSYLLAGVPPTLASDFSHSRYVLNGVPRSPSDVLTVTSGTVNVRRADGTYVTTTAGQLPSSDLGLLCEGSATNIYAVSEGAVGIWLSQVNATLATSTTVGPTGSASFYATVTSTSNGGYRQTNLTVPPDTLTRTVSVHLRKKSGGQIAQFRAWHFGGAESNVTLNLTTGEVTFQQNLVSIVDGGDYWRVGLKTTNAGFTGLIAIVTPVQGGIGSCEVGGLMGELGPVMTSYVQGGQTRAATTVTVADSVVTAAAGHVRLTGKAAPGIAASNQVLWQYGTASDGLAIYRDTSRVLHFKTVTGGVTQSDRSFGALADGASVDAEIAWEGTTARYRVGSVVFLEYGVTLPTGMTTERLGCSAAGEQWGGRVTYLGGRPTSDIVVPNFGDSFNRADTSPGSLGTAPDGDPYGLYGAYVGSFPLPADAHGQIVGKMFITDVPAVTYAYKLSVETAHHIGCVFSIVHNDAWDSESPTGTSGVALLISGSTDTGRLTEDIGPHIGLSRASGGLLVQTRRLVADSGNFITYALIPPANVGIVADGRLMSCDVEIFPNDDLTITVNGIANTFNVPGLYAYPGKIVCWEIYETDNPYERSRIHAAYSRDLVKP